MIDSHNNIVIKTKKKGDSCHDDGGGSFTLTIESDKNSDLIRVLQIWVAEFIRVFVKGFFVCVRSAGCWPCLPRRQGYCV